MLAWWAAFARQGEPAVPGLPHWPRYEGGETVMRLDPAAPGAFDAGAVHQCAFWRALYPEALGD
jgi:para-nitrobenzyl esterase